MQVYVTHADIQAAEFSVGTPAPGISKGGSVPVRNVTTPTEIIGDYTYLHTYVSAYNATRHRSECIMNGVYTFGVGEQLTWA
jgi:hypothetical protein